MGNLISRRMHADLDLAPPPLFAPLEKCTCTSRLNAALSRRTGSTPAGDHCGSKGVGGEAPSPCALQFYLGMISRNSWPMSGRQDREGTRTV